MKIASMKNKQGIKKYEDALNEAFSSSFGGGSPVLGISSNHYKGYPSGGKSHHAGRSMTGMTGYDLKAIQREEERQHKAPDLLPFPLDVAFDNVSDAITSIDRLRAQIKIAIDNNIILSGESHKKLTKVNEYLEDTLGKFIKIGKIIEKCNLSDTIG